MSARYELDHAMLMESLKGYRSEDEEAERKINGIRKERQAAFDVLVQDTVSLNIQAGVQAAAAHAAGVKTATAGAMEAKADEIAGLKAKIGRLQDKLGTARGEKVVLQEKVDNMTRAVVYYSTAERSSLKEKQLGLQAAKDRATKNRRLGRHDVALERSVVLLEKKLAVYRGVVPRAYLLAVSRESYNKLRARSRQMKPAAEGAGVLLAWRTRMEEVWDLSVEEMAGITS